MTDRQTDKQTDRHTDHNTSLPYQGGEVITNVGVALVAILPRLLVVGCCFLEVLLSLVVWQELQPTVGDLRYAVLHGMLLTVSKNPQHVQKALKNFTEILHVDVRLFDPFQHCFTTLLLLQKSAKFRMVILLIPTHPGSPGLTVVKRVVVVL